MKQVLKMEPIRQAFLIGYAYAMGVRYGICACMALDGAFNESDHPRDKAGKFAKNGSGNESATGKTFPNTGKNLQERKSGKTPQQYLREAKGNVRRAIVDYYDNELRGGYVNTHLEMNGKMVPVRVEFDTKGRNEFRKFGEYGGLILNVLPFVADVVASGEYAGRHIEKNHFPQIAFHTKLKTVPTPHGKKWVAVDIGESKKGDLHAYSVNTEGIPSFNRKKKHLGKEQKKKIGLDSVLLPSSRDSVRFFTGYSHQANKMMLDQKDTPSKCRVIGIRILG